MIEMMRVFVDDVADQIGEKEAIYFFALKLKGGLFNLLILLISVANLELAKLANKMEKLATTDSLTGLANVRKFRDFLGLEWRRVVIHRTS